MAHSFSTQINNLRKRSRILLAHLEENSKKVKCEIKKLCLQNLVSTQEDIFNKQRLIPERNSEIWRLRNDSSGVSGALCPDYFRLSPKYKSTSVPDMTSAGRILITSSKKQPKPLRPRKPVKECYCYSEARKMPFRSIRTKHKLNVTCHHCKSHFNALPTSQNELFKNNTDKSQMRLIGENNNAQATIFPSISNETLRKVQKIDYPPRSQFLRNVQSKISSLHNISSRSLSEPPRSPNQPLNRVSSSTNYHPVNKPWSNRLVHKNSRAQVPQEFMTIHDKQSSEIDKETNVSKHSRTYINKDMQIPSQKVSTISTVKRATTSKTSVPEQRRETLVLKSPPRSRRNTRLISKDNARSHEGIKMTEKNIKHLSKEDVSKFNNYSKYHGQRNWWSEDHRTNEDRTEGPLKDDIKELHKFREQNYFDTHGSSHTLLDSESSGSLLQYQLNERLYPERVGKVHKHELVVSMPPCVTKQRKTIHYFPKNIVRQEKNNCNTNYKKRRYQSCPLTGHAIDLGILKVCYPPNSLALKYQKGVS